MRNVKIYIWETMLSMNSLDFQKDVRQLRMTLESGGFAEGFAMNWGGLQDWVGLGRILELGWICKKNWKNWEA